MPDPAKSEVELASEALYEQAEQDARAQGAPILTAVVARLVARLCAAEIRIRALEAKLT